MQTVRGHYDKFLGSVYSWILGDIDNARDQNAALFDSMDLAAAPNAIAIDLGCGPGSQSLPLAELGYEVTGIDFCQELLDELQRNAGDLSIETVCDDILNFRMHSPEPADLIVCMGDTLVHLPTVEAVDSLLDDVCDALKPGGEFIYAIRNYIDQEPGGAARFVPVRASENQIFTCFLDYKDDVVHVHDILHRKINGDWNMRISDYLKLRLDSRKINQRLEDKGFRLTKSAGEDGMIVVHGLKTT